MRHDIAGPRAPFESDLGLITQMYVGYLLLAEVY